VTALMQVCTFTSGAVVETPPSSLAVVVPQLVSRDFATVAGILQETAVSLVEAIQSRFGVESGDAIRSSRDMGALLAPDDVAFAGDQSCILGTADYLHLHSLVEQADEVRVLL